jgi:group I intron endonuclease
MIGIYIITNKLTNQAYIGKSIDIERRFAEHKTPKAHGNPRLHADIQKFGIDNFDFKVLEECKESELKSKELQFIKAISPYYNTVGKKISDETRKKISDTVKIWWEGLPEEHKQKVIKNNLKGPGKGHSVSKETREKLRNFNLENMGIKVMIVETGQVFSKIRLLEEHVGAGNGTVYAYFRGKIKTVKGYHVVKCRD